MAFLRLSTSLRPQILSLHQHSVNLAGQSVKPPHVPSNTLSKLSVRPASGWGPGHPRRSPQYNRFSNAQQIYTLWHSSPAFRYGTGAVAAFAGVFVYVNLERVPISGRLRFNCFTSGFEEQIGNMTVQSILQEYRGRILPPTHPDSQMVNRVLRRLIPASGLEHLNWEVRVIDDRHQQNAFVAPGGKVFVYSGILPICGNEDGLAAVLGHEISHQLAHHTGEKLSKSLLITLPAILIALSFDISAQASQLIVDLVLERPGSRKMEVSLIGFSIQSVVADDCAADRGRLHRPMYELPSACSAS